MKKISWIFLLVLFTQIGYSQVKYLDTVRIGKQLLYMPQDAIKVDALKILSGDVVFAYEHVFSYNNAFEIEIGPTISMIGFNRLNFLGRSIDNKIPNYNYQTAEGSTGFLLSLGYKKYLLEDYPGLNGVFIEPRIKFRNYNNKSSFATFNPEYTKVYKNKLFQGLVTIDAGMDHYFKSGFGLEYYMSLGLAMNSFRYNHYYESFNDVTQEWTNGIAESHKNFANITFSLGLKLFIGF